MSHMLKVGDTVLWSGPWGENPPQVTQIVAMQVRRDGENGKSVQDFPWEDVGENIVVALSNGHWAFGHRIAPIRSSEVQSC